MGKIGEMSADTIVKTMSEMKVNLAKARELRTEVARLETAQKELLREVAELDGRKENIVKEFARKEATLMVKVKDKEDLVDKSLSSAKEALANAEAKRDIAEGLRKDADTNEKKAKESLRRANDLESYNSLKMAKLDRLVEMIKSELK